MDMSVNFLGKYEERIADRPWIAIIIVVAITIFMGYFASNVSMDSSEESFQLDSPVARAQDRVTENYGTQGEQFSVIFIANGNVLSKDILLKQLELERDIQQSEYSEFIKGSQRSPSGISSPAKVIAQAGFLNRAFTKIMERGNGSNPELIFRKLSPVIYNLSIEDMETILEGGNIRLNLPDLGFDEELDFQPFQPSMTSVYLRNAPFENILSYLLSKDYDTNSQTAGKALLSITLSENLDQEKSLEIQREFQSLAEGVESSDESFDARAVGSAIVNEEINEASGRNIGLLMPLAFVVVIIILFIVYRTFSDTFLNLIALVMAIVWVYGIGYLLGFTFSPNITAVPLLMIGLGIDYGIHYTLRYREEIKKEQDINRSVQVTGATVGLAILLTTITTMVGFSSGVISNISAVRQFGVLSSLGIASSFVVMLTFFPAAKVLLDRRSKAKNGDLTDGRGYGSSIFGSSFEEEEDYEDFGGTDCSNCNFKSLKIGAVVAKKPLVVLGVVAIVTSIGIYGAYELDARYNFQDFLPEDLEITESFNILLEDFDFSQERVYFLAEGDVTLPSVFVRISEVQQSALSSPFALGSEPPESPIQLALSLSNPASPQFNPQFAEVWRNEVDPNDDGQVDGEITRANVKSVYDALYRFASEDARRVLKKTSRGYSGLVIRIPVSSQNSESGELVDDMEQAVKPLKDQGLESVIATGGPIVSHQTFESINQGQVNSVLITFLISLAILTGLYFYRRGSTVLGLVTVFPLVLVILWTLGSMYFLGIPLNPVTVTIAAIMVGLGVDYSIHLTQRYIEDSERIERPECALCASVGHTGSALFGSAITTVSGFAILSFAIIPPLAQFGQVSALGIFFAFLASVLVLPTFLLYWKRRVERD